MADDQDKSQQTEEPTAQTAGTGARIRRRRQIHRSHRLHSSGGRHPGHRHVRPIHRARHRQAADPVHRAARADGGGWRGPGFDDARLAAAAGLDPGAFLGRDDRRPALAGHVLQSRPSFTLDKLMPDFSKVSLLAGLARMFGAGRLDESAQGPGQDRHRRHGDLDPALARARHAGSHPRRNRPAAWSAT